jgi:hypothetical protein
MKKQWQSLVFLCMAWMALAAPASAIPVVATDTTYTLYLEGLESGNAAAGRFNFDGEPERIPRGNGFVSVNETETVIDDTSSRIIITLTGTTDLFPAAEDVALLGIGTFGDGLDLLFPVRLIDARVSFLQPGGVLVDTTDNLASQATQNNPWDGLFPNAFELIGIEGIGNRNVQVIAFEFLVSTQAEVPEPGIFLLGGIGLLGLVAARRRNAGAQRR